MARTIPVDPALSSYVRSIRVEEGEEPPPAEGYKVLPTPFPVLGFQFRGCLNVLRAGESMPLEPAGITGLQSSFRMFRGETITRTILVTLHPHGAFVLLAQDMKDFTDGHIGFSQIYPERQTRILTEGLFSADSAEAAVAKVQRFLLVRTLASKSAAHPLLIEASEILLRCPGARIRELASDLHVSERQLERLFKQQIGVGPKQFSSLARFHNALRQLPFANSWAGLAAEAGYADQAHFIRSFAAYAGTTPGQYRVERTDT